MTYCADCPALEADLKADLASKTNNAATSFKHALFAIPAKAWANIKAKRQQRTNRAAFQNLLSLDDATLKDIGVARGDVMWANSLPVSVNAAEELRLISLQGRAKAG